jgi:hypothetical protein
MTSLPTPSPVLAFEDAGDGIAMLEKPIELRASPVSLADGSSLRPDRLTAAGFFVFRRTAPAATAEVWDEASGAWRNAASLPIAGLEPAPFAFLPDEPQPWFTIFVAAGQKDAAEADRFRRAVLGYPRYFFRSYFAPKEDVGATPVLSAPTAELQFIGVADRVRAGIAAGSNESLEDARELHLFLRNESLQLIGEVGIYNQGGQARIELVKWDGGATPTARVSLNADGTITLNDSLRITAGGGNATLSCNGTLRLEGAAVRATNFLPL